MENKGLNIFNSAYVLADPATATDTDYERILGVIGHEYFHNWTGNRVTVRDWFQLTLKEGLTVFRDQWFTGDQTSETVKRIEDVRGLRSRQFVEDQGPMSHPIRPESYISMDNFYTGTVYVKGAEVVRMYRTLLGEKGFKDGMKLYFERHDGTAVTCDDFRAAMADATGADLSQFENWYSQAGTPVLDVSHSYDEAKKEFSITFKQHTPSTPGQDASTKKPQLIPIVLGLLSSTSGKELLPSTTLKLTHAEQTFTIGEIAEKPVPSILREFSAPVRLVHTVEQSDSELAFLMAHDTDSFNKWDAGSRLATRVILSLAKIGNVEKIQVATLPAEFVAAVGAVLRAAMDCASSSSSSSLVAYALQLPDEMTLSQEMAVIDPDALSAARKRVKAGLAQMLAEEFNAIYQAVAPTTPSYVFSSSEVGRRRLRNTVLDYLSAGPDQSVAVSLIKRQFDTAQCMTDKIAALGCLVSKQGCPEREEALQSFHATAAGDALVLNKWFAIQAMADLPLPDLLDSVKKLKLHPDFSISNPNRARSLISTFAGNMKAFHAKDGQGYQFIADCVLEIDKLNPQVASRLATVFSQFKRFDDARQGMMQQQLERIKNHEGLSKDTFEIVSRTLR
jgi:aminopeptidase N